MKFHLPTPMRAWMLAPFLACVLVIWIGAVRIAHLDYLAEAGGSAVAMDHKSPSGYADGVRKFIPASRDAVSLEPVSQTQQLLARDGWRVRRVDYDNAPSGRDVLSTSPYLWWLGSVAAIHSLLSGIPLGAAVERAALFADPLMHLLLIAGTSWFVARRFGAAAAVAIALGFAALFPFAGAFAPGQPRVDGLAAAAAFWSVLLLLAPFGATGSEARTQRSFLFAGVAGGLSLWLDAAAGLPVIAGIALAAHAMSWLARRSTPGGMVGPLPWRMWATGGAAACLVAYCLEFLPTGTQGLRLDVISPLHGLAWLGAGDLLARSDGWLRRTTAFRWKRDLVPVVLTVAVIALPLVLTFQNRRELFVPDPSLLRLTPIAENAVASGLWTWISQEGVSLLAFAALAPLAIAAPLIIQMFRAKSDPGERMVAALALGPIVVALVFASMHLRRWVVLDAALLAGLVVFLMSGRAAVSRLRLLISSAALAVMLVVGIVTLVPKGASDSVSESEFASLIERDLAHWLTQRSGAGRPVVIASPTLAASLAFEGGFRALGSPYRENRAGFDLSLRIAGTSSQDEAHALATNRGITHVVLASWDTSLDEFAALGDTEGKSLVAQLHQWLPPRWLRPVPYPVPQVPGVRSPTVLVFEVVEVQEISVALSMLAEYFVESGRGGLARSAAEAIGRLFPEDLGAQVARAKAAVAIGDRGQAGAAFDVVMKLLNTSAAQNLPWERRVSLALLLAEANQFDLSRTQVERCIGEIDESRMRLLSPATLHGFVGLANSMGVKGPDPRLWELAQRLVSPPK